MLFYCFVQRSASRCFGGCVKHTFQDSILGRECRPAFPPPVVGTHDGSVRFICAAQCSASQGGCSTVSQDRVMGRRRGRCAHSEMLDYGTASIHGRSSNCVACRVAPAGVARVFRGHCVMQVSRDAPRSFPNHATVSRIPLRILVTRRHGQYSATWHHTRLLDLNRFS